MSLDEQDSGRTAGDDPSAAQPNGETPNGEEPRVFQVQRDLKSWRLRGLNARAGRRAFLGGSLAAGAATAIPRRSAEANPDGNGTNGQPAEHRVARLALSIVALQAVAPAHRRRVSSIAFSPDGALLVSGSDDQLVKLWSLGDVQHLKTLAGHPFAVSSVAVTPDGLMAASGSGRLIKLWSLPAGDAVADLSGHMNTISTVAAIPTGGVLASSAADGTTRLWSLANQSQLASSRSGGPGAHYLKGAPDGTRLVALAGTALYCWSVPDGQQLGTVSVNGIGPVTLLPDGQRIAYGLGNTVRIANLPDFAVAATSQPHAETVSALAASPDGQYLVSAAGLTITIWSVADLQQPVGTLQAQSGVTALAIPNHSKMLASIESNIVRFWSLPEGAPLVSVESQLAAVTAHAFSEDGRWFAAGHADGHLSVWDLQAGGLRRPLSDPGLSPADVTPVPTPTITPTPRPTNTPMPPGQPGTTKPGQRGGDLTGPSGEVRTVPCGTPLPPGWTCTCNCVTAPAPQPSGGSHYWFPN